jgi:hypothetical protein
MRAAAPVLPAAAAASAFPNLEGHVEGIYLGLPEMDAIIDSNAYSEACVYSSSSKGYPEAPTPCRRP